jgi:hypothetical protein
MLHKNFRRRWPRLSASLVAAAVLRIVALTAQAADKTEPEIVLLYGINEIFPSALISVTDQSKFPRAVRDQRGDPRGLISVMVTAPKDNCPVKITLAATEVFGESSISVILPKQGERYRIAPYLVLDHAKIMRLKHPIPAEVLRAKVELGDSGSSSATRSVRIHAINDCLISTRFGTDVMVTSPLAAAFVNENNPELPARIIRHALDHHISRFIGYAGGPNVVESEVKAIYRSLQDMGFKYAAMTQASVESGQGAGTFSQWIRLSSDSIRSDQANCIDGTVILASVLTRLRLRVVFFISPSHAFLGVWLKPTDPTLASVLVIETTMLGTHEFLDAKKTGTDALNAELAKDPRTTGRPWSDLRSREFAVIPSSPAGGPGVKIHPKPPALFVVDIQDARLKYGIQPVPELMPGSRWVIPLPSGPR